MRQIVLAAATVATLFASPALAQSFDPSIGSGNIVGPQLAGNQTYPSPRPYVAGPARRAASSVAMSTDGRPMRSPKAGTSAATITGPSTTRRAVISAGGDSRLRSTPRRSPGPSPGAFLCDLRRMAEIPRRPTPSRHLGKIAGRFILSSLIALRSQR